MSWNFCGGFHQETSFNRSRCHHKDEKNLDVDDYSFLGLRPPRKHAKRACLEVPGIIKRRSAFMMLSLLPHYLLKTVALSSTSLHELHQS